MAWTFFEITVNFLQALMLLIFIKSRVHITRHERAADALYMIIQTSFLTLYLFVDMPLPDSVGFILPFIYALFASEDRWYVCAYWVVVLAVLFFSTANLAIHIFSTLPGLSYDAIMANGVSRILFVLATNLLLFLVLFSASRIRAERFEAAWPVLLGFLLTIAFLFMVEEAVFQMQLDLEAHGIDGLWPLYANIGLCAGTLCFLSVFNKMTRIALRNERYREEAKAWALNEQHQLEMERVYKDLCEREHDRKQHDQTLAEMVLRSENQEAKNYLAEYQENQPDRMLFMTGCTSVDALLHTKYQSMKKLGIPFKFTGYPLKPLPIPATDFGVILGNLLDNAIEAVQRMAEPPATTPIHLKFSRAGDMLYVRCTNPCDPRTLRRKDGAWLSSKESEGRRSIHGVGLRNIEQAARRSGGRCTFEAGEHAFAAQVVLPYPIEREGSV